MEGRITPVVDLTAAEIGAWQALAARAAEPNPYFEPAFVVPAARNLPGAPGLLGVWSERELVFAAPIVALRRWRKLPLRSVATWCHPECALGTPLLDPDPEVAISAWHCALDEMTAAPRPPHLAALERMSAQGPVADALTAAIGPKRVRTYESYSSALLERRLDHERPVAGLSGRHRRELDRRARQVEELTGGAYETRDIAAEPGAVDAFLRLEAAGWKGTAGTALSSSEATRAFIVDALRSFFDKGRFHLLATTTPAGIAAAVCLIRTGSTIAMFKMAFDESLARYSPGTQLVVDLVEWFRRDGSLQTIDTCAAPDNAFANRLFPDRRSMATLVVPFDGRARLLASAAPPLVAWARAVRRRT